MSPQERLLVAGTFVIAAAASGLAQNPPAPAAASASASASAPAASVGLGGRWRLNVEQSDDARQKLEQARAANGGGHGGHGGPGGGGGGWGGPGGGRGGGGGGGRWGGHGRPSGDAEPASMSERRPGLQGLLEPAAEITIAENASEITILEKDGAIRVLHADGAAHKTDNGLSEIKTRRDQDRLVVETESSRGGKMTEVFRLSADRRQLTNEIRVKGRFGDVTLRRVYDAIPPE